MGERAIKYKNAINCFMIKQTSVSIGTRIALITSKIQIVDS